MKRINQYIYGGCIAYTVASIISIAIHLMEHIETFQVKSHIGMIIIIILAQTILYFMENLQIKSEVAHIVLELLTIILITFTAGIPLKLIKNYSIHGVLEVITIILITYAITIITLYLNSKVDAEYINKKLKEHG